MNCYVISRLFVHVEHHTCDGFISSGVSVGEVVLVSARYKVFNSGIGVLKAANVDINAIVSGAGEALIVRIKAEQKEDKING
ncbi:MAG: hypothetical protein J1E60_00640 [Christensenellaceae bacterium]|nr:hypothetical protein [Christensenellaceae bacterium]